MKNFYLKFKLSLQLTIVVNLIFVLWILYNRINENFDGTLVEKISYFTLIILLSTNSYLLIRRIKNNCIM